MSTAFPRISDYGRRPQTAGPRSYAVSGRGSQANVPFLPGNTFSNPAKRRFHKSHCFDKRSGVDIVDEQKPGIGGDPLPTQRSVTRPMSSARFYPKSRELNTAVPAWVAFDKQVLRFDAYFKEGVHERPGETYRVRKVVILFYLEDDTCQVVEPHSLNSGIPQGTLIRRHRIPKEGSYGDDFHTVEDLNVGTEVTMYAKTFRIVDCDAFTRNFLEKLGFSVGQPEAMPGDPYSMKRSEDVHHKPTYGKKRGDGFKQFLENDRRVLRFFCVWDDSPNMFGDERFMVLHYFLADDTVEVRETIGGNAGRDPLPSFMKRQRLPRVWTGLLALGEKPAERNYYTDADLRIGTTLNVMGRRFLLYDCDAFTREYYYTNYGISDFTPLELPKARYHKIEREKPPPTGYGTEEDSLACMHSLIPKPPRRDLRKMIEKEGKNLRFQAQFTQCRAADRSRRFVITYYLGDDTVSVHEPVERNSGRKGGKFLERSRLKKASVFPERYLMPQDFFVGATVDVGGHSFLLTDADEYAFRYMEHNAEEFPVANLRVVCQKAAQTCSGDIRGTFEQADGRSVGWVPPDVFQNVLVSLGIDLCGHELLTLMRAFDSNGDGRIAYPGFVEQMGR